MKRDDSMKRVESSIGDIITALEVSILVSLLWHHVGLVCCAI